MDVGRNGNATLQPGALQHAERLLCSLTGIRAAKILAGPGHRISGISVIANGQLSPRQVARNVQSALMAQYSLTIDHRIVEVLEPEPEPGTPARAPAPRHGNGNGTHMTGDDGAAHAARPLAPSLHAATLTVCAIELERRQHRLRARVVLESEQALWTGEAETLDMGEAQLEAVAAATLQALRAATGTTALLRLAGARQVELGGREYIMIAIEAAHGRELHRLAGAAPAGESEIDAAALATLQAASRWLNATATHTASGRTAAAPEA